MSDNDNTTAQMALLGVLLIGAAKAIDLIPIPSIPSIPTPTPTPTDTPAPADDPTTTDQPSPAPADEPAPTDSGIPWRVFHDQPAEVPTQDDVGVPDPQPEESPIPEEDKRLFHSGPTLTDSPTLAEANDATSTPSEGTRVFRNPDMDEVTSKAARNAKLVMGFGAAGALGKAAKAARGTGAATKALETAGKLGGSAGATGALARGAAADEQDDSAVYDHQSDPEPTESELKAFHGTTTTTTSSTSSTSSSSSSSTSSAPDSDLDDPFASTVSETTTDEEHRAFHHL